MIDFGYSLTPSNKIDLGKERSSLHTTLFTLSPDIAKCIGCGSCVASCSAGRINGTTALRSAILLIDRGMEDEALPLIKECMLCGKCRIVCPRGINTRDIVLAINELLKKGKR